MVTLAATEIISLPSTTELPALITQAGKKEAWRFLEFFTVNIRNKKHSGGLRTGGGRILRWCEGRGIARIEDVQPVHVAAISRSCSIRTGPRPSSSIWPASACSLTGW